MSSRPCRGAGARTLVAVLVASCALVAASPAARAQQVDPAVADLRDHDVTFEDGALTNGELDDLDSTTAKLQDDGGFFKVAVLADNVTRFDTARDFGAAVLAGLGGDGRVMVVTSNEVGVASNVDSAAEVDDAEKAAADALTNGSSPATATKDAAGKLGIDTGGGGGGIGWFWILLLIALPLLLLWFLWRAARRMRQGAAAATAEEIGAAETKVRASVDRAANDLLELADRVDMPGAPPEAKTAFGAGAETFTQAQSLLEGADTRPELERAWPTVVQANWQLDTARALLEGGPVPARPEPDDLFPPVVVASRGPAAEVPTPASAPTSAPAPASRPEPHYREPSTSPWLTAAAMAAMAMLSQRGMRQPQTRPSMDEGSFGSWSGGLPPMPSSGRSRNGGGSSSRGGRIVTPSGQKRRGMGRR